MGALNNVIQLILEGSIVNNIPADQAINGWATVTTALDATGTGSRIDVGGGNLDHVDLSTLNPGNLGPGDVVNIFYRSQPYITRLVFITDGTEENPIIINGVTKASGSRPKINCANAITVQEQDWSKCVNF